MPPDLARVVLVVLSLVAQLSPALALEGQVPLKKVPIAEAFANSLSHRIPIDLSLPANYVLGDSSRLENIFWVEEGDRRFLRPNKDGSLDLSVLRHGWFIFGFATALRYDVKAKKFPLELDNSPDVASGLVAATKMQRIDIPGIPLLRMSVDLRAGKHLEMVYGSITPDGQCIKLIYSPAGDEYTARDRFIAESFLASLKRRELALPKAAGPDARDTLDTALNRIKHLDPAIVKISINTTIGSDKASRTAFIKQSIELRRNTLGLIRAINTIDTQSELSETSPDGSTTVYRFPGLWTFGHGTVELTPHGDGYEIKRPDGTSRLTKAELGALNVDRDAGLLAAISGSRPLMTTVSIDNVLRGWVSLFDLRLRETTVGGQKMEGPFDSQRLVALREREPVISEEVALAFTDRFHSMTLTIARGPVERWDLRVEGEWEGNRFETSVTVQLGEVK